LADDLRVLPYHGRSVEVEIDDRDMRGGDKVWQWIKRGIPIRLEVGPRDMADDSVFFGRRDKPHKDKASMKRGAFVDGLIEMLDEIQQNLLDRAETLLKANSRVIESKDEFYAYFTPKNKDQPEIHGGFAWAHYSGEREVEEQIKKDLAVTVRVIPMDSEDDSGGPGTCIFTGKPSKRRVVWAKSY
jgi:prolyl-tRNA synthetase